MKNPMLSLYRTMGMGLLAISLASLCPQSGYAQATSATANTFLQDRVVALTQLIHFRFRDNESLLQQRRQEVEAVLRDWNAMAGSSPHAQQQMTNWLDVAIRSTMPGRNGKLPRAPFFEDVFVQSSDALFENPVIENSSSKRIVTLEPIEGNDPMADTDPMVDFARPITRKPASPRRSKWSRHPSAAPLKWSDPFSEEPQSNSNPFLRGSDRYETRRPTFGDGKGITVDLAELSAEVRGYNAALRNLSQRLARRGEMNTSTLTAIAAELERLETERRFLDLYREGLTDAGQKSLPTSPSAELLYEVVRRKTAAKLSKTPRGRNEERRTLEGLAARLARL